MSTVYLYNSNTGEYYVSKALEILNPFMMEKLLSEYSDDIFNGYGDIVIDPVSLAGSFSYKYVYISVDEDNNPIEVTKAQLINNPTREGLFKVRLKDLREHQFLDTDKYLIKFFNNEFHKFEIDNISKYNPEDNTYNVDLERFRNDLISKISNSELEIRNHGFYYSVFGNDKTYVQPFREGTPNDSVVFTNLKNELPIQYRQIYLFNLSPEGKRLTEPGTYEVIYMNDVTDKFLQLQIVSIQAYGGYIKLGINKLIHHVKHCNELRELMLISKGYVDVILKGISDELEKNREFVELRTEVEVHYRNVPPRIRPSISYQI